MNSRIVLRTSLLKITLLCAILAMVIGVSSGAALAQDGSAKVAVCNSLKVVQQTTEFKDLQLTLQNDAKQLSTEADQRKANLNKMQGDLALYKPETKEFATKNGELLHATIDYEAWANVMQREMARKTKQQIKSLYDKMDASIATLAKSKGISIVVNDQHPDITDANMEKADPNQLAAALATRTILFDDAKVDITDEVIAAMNRDYVKH